MKTKIILVTALIVAIVCGVASLMTSKHQPPAPVIEVKKTAPPSAAAPVAVAPVPVAQAPTEPPPTVVTPAAPPVKAVVPVVSQSQEPPPPVQPAPSGKEPRADPMARVAMSLVGVDTDAEDYWLDAINDPSLSAQEREDLIEDLNEEGLSDPKHPSPEDLPVILYRIRLIEELAPFVIPVAVDEVPSKSFPEVYKDLLNLAALASGTGGDPVN